MKYSDKPFTQLEFGPSKCWLIMRRTRSPHHRNADGTFSYVSDALTHITSFDLTIEEGDLCVYDTDGSIRKARDDEEGWCVALSVA